MIKQQQNSKSEQFFTLVTQWPKTSKNFKPGQKTDIYATAMSFLGRGVIRYPMTVLVLAGVIATAGMFAAIAIGLGVDFAVHTVERLVVLIKDKGKTIDEAITALCPSTGRALFINFLALALGFGVLISSEVVPLIRFGTLVAVAVSVSFIASMTVLLKQAN